jgi:DNA/RNA-binding domain of Phe-tRNA-synthetase-like protein
VVSDEKKLVAIYPYRDADNTKVTEKTKNIMMAVCGVPRIPKQELEATSKVAFEYVTRFCGGTKRV